MKNYDEVTTDLLKRRDRYVADQKRKRKRRLSVATSLCCCGLIAVLGFGMWQGRMFSTTPPDLTKDDDVYVDKNENNIQSNNESNLVSNNENPSNNNIISDDLCDKIGIVVIDGVTYVQFQTEAESYTLDTYLGAAGDYEGTYKTYLNDIATKLYTTKEDPDVLIIKLENGGTVALKKEKQ